MYVCIHVCMWNHISVNLASIQMTCCMWSSRPTGIVRGFRFRKFIWEFGELGGFDISKGCMWIIPRVSILLHFEDECMIYHTFGTHWNNVTHLSIILVQETAFSQALLGNLARVSLRWPLYFSHCYLQQELM